MSARPADVPLTAYFSYARRHGLVIVLCMFLGVVAGVAVGHRVATYVGTASVLAPPLDLGPHGLPDTPTTPLREKDAVTPDTEAEIATSTPVLTAVRKATGLKANFPELAKRVTIDAPTNTQVLTISFEARQPKAALAGAEAAAEAFIVMRARLISDRQAADVGALNAQIAALRTDLAAAGAQAATSGRTSSIVAQIEQGAIVDKIRSLQRSETRLATAKTNAGTILRPATESAIRVRLGREVPIASGLMLGFLGGLALGRLRRRRFTTAWDLQRAVSDGEPIDVIPISYVVTSSHRGERHGIGRRFGRDGGLRRLRNVVVSSGGGLTLITGPARTDVTAKIGWGFARTLARLDEPVAILVAEDNAAALNAINLSSGALLDIESSLVTTGLRRGDVGDVAAYHWPTGTDGSAAAAALRRAYPHVVVVAPGEPNAAVCAIARVADRVVISAERRRTAVRDVVNVVRRLRLVGATVRTSLLVGASR
jgi:capsular polysaccharide biosynthesis protein